MDEQAKQALDELMTQAKASRSLLRRLEIFGFWTTAPLVALLPAKLAYRAACRRGDLIARYWPEEPAVFARNLRQILGETFSPAEADRVAREALRAGSCDIIDIMRLRSRTRPLRKLVEIRGLEHVEAAKAGGKGAILCTAHFGSYDSAWSLIHASGFPVTEIGHWWWDYMPGISPAVKRFWDWAHGRRVLRYRQRPNIEPWSAGIMAAMQAVAVLRRNEVVAICSDAFQTEGDKTRAAKVPFLGREATFMPGVINLAKRSGAPILMMFMYRSDDYRHQVLEISPPLSMDGDPDTAFRRCVAAMDAAIRSNPAQWHFWGETERGLIELGVIPEASAPGSVPVA
jgi:KDO2-lipid IV(A) lauroyltransferase